MKCPIQIIAGLTKGDTLNPVLMDCLKEKCAWWEKISERCGFLDMLYQLDGIRTALFAIADKMPHAGQFTK